MAHGRMGHKQSCNCCDAGFCCETRLSAVLDFAGHRKTQEQEKVIQQHTINTPTHHQHSHFMHFMSSCCQGTGGGWAVTVTPVGVDEGACSNTSPVLVSLHTGQVCSLTSRHLTWMGPEQHVVVPQLRSVDLPPIFEDASPSHLPVHLMHLGGCGLGS